VSKPSHRRSSFGAIFHTSLITALIGFGFYVDHADSIAPKGAASQQAALAREQASQQVKQLVEWATLTGDHGSLPFVVIDKAKARLFAFDGEGRLRGSGPVLLGAAHADEPGAAATPAGRFMADAWLSARGDGIVWANAEGELALHALPSPWAPGRGLQRLASAHVEDKRISEGSLHVAADFYREFLGTLRSHPSIAYVIPETRPIEQFFGSYAVDHWNLIAQSPRRTPARSPS
jgi:hypothetical protein